VRPIIFALAIVLMAVGPVAAHSTQACLNSAASKAAVAAAVAACEAKAAAEIAALKAEIAALRASIPCSAFAYSATEAAAFIGKSGTFCVVVETVTKCADDYCASWVKP
jgi:hypothetical protein